MNQQPLMVTSIGKFAGQFSDVDPDDSPAGTMILQVNAMSVTPGTLTTRGGLQEITLDTLE